MTDIPDGEECIRLLKKSGCSEKVINHCETVCDIALNIARHTDADLKLVEAGALLHDIGRSKTHDIYHAVEGVKIAKKLDLPEKIILIIERHIGAGLSQTEAKKLGLPAKDYMPLSIEEKIVCHADNLTDSGKRQPLEVEVEKALEKGLNEYALKLVKLHKELSEIIGFDLNKI